MRTSSPSTSVQLTQMKPILCGVRAAFARRSLDPSQRLWEPARGLYADEASKGWSVLAPYRGQNATMHACEALIAAFEASGEREDKAKIFRPRGCQPRHLNEWAKLLLILTRHGADIDP